ncbi:UNVERIFIED_CONTAM: hypothetical protein K2H54_003589 [Gekko kuhli]
MESKVSARSPKVSTYFNREATTTAPVPETNDDNNMAPVEEEISETRRQDKRRTLKIFATKLYNARIRFRWSPTSDIQVFRDGTLHQATDAATGKQLLQLLKLQLTDEEEQRLLNT